ncbi:hypothetical protein CQA66_08805 [Helicobacter aurati]|uniref:Uncharacterized protein n=1 Tax=Helicobacter aurati TaxID=137778 RepID=A0A3D8IXY0_9HELI|nr:hypothetical protein [Helicobacter aurati]RDU69775.1 hypothetical protein CQA66_08805 [Helicobacter aurati]
MNEILAIKEACQTEGFVPEESQIMDSKRDVSAFAKPQHDNDSCHSERSEESLQNNRDVSLSAKAQHDKQDSDCHSEPALAGEESLGKESRGSKRDVSAFAKPQHDKIPDTSTLESQIDSLVYQLYNLTNEEIKIVESK